MSTVRLHATTVAIEGHGVMIFGPSGSGKSDLALRLIDRGAVLVSDDYTAFSTRDGVVIAAPPATIAGRMELRGIGIVDMPHMAETTIAMAVRLGYAVERMPHPCSERVAGIEIPCLAMSAFEASAPIKVEIALSRLVKG